MIEARVVPEGYVWTKAAVGQLLDADRRYTVLYQRHVLAPVVATDWTRQNPKRAFRLVALLTRRQARIVGELEGALTIYAAKPSEGHPAHPPPTGLVNTSVLITGRVTRLDLSEEVVWLDGAASCIKTADFSAYFAQVHPPKKDDSGATLPATINVGSNVAQRPTMEDTFALVGQGFAEAAWGGFDRH